MHPALVSSQRSDWQTPPSVFAPLDREFHFTLDVCAPEENAKCPRYFTPERDGLSQPWSGVCWCNPPYTGWRGRSIVPWLEKAVRERTRGVTTVCLLPARTDTGWWHTGVIQADEIRYLRGRITFVGASNAAPFPSVVVIYRGRKESA